MNLRARLEILEELSQGVGAAQTSELGLLSETVELDGLRNSVGPIPRGRIEELGEFVAGEGLPGPPTITLVSPNLGDIDGFIPFELTGTNFIHLVSVTIGGLPATSLQVTDPQHVNGLTPALPPGVYDVVITTFSGSFTLPGAFESWDADQIVAPAVAHVYDSEEGLTLTGALVDIWADQGALAGNVTGVGATRPSYLSKRFGDNLRHALLYDGVDDVLVLPGALAFVNRTVFAAVKWNTSGGGGTSEIINGTSGSIIDFALDATGGLTTMRTYDANIPANRRSPDDPELNSGAQSAFVIGGGSAKIVGETYNGAAGLIKFYLNNVQQGPDVATTVVGANWLRIGSGGGVPCDGEIGAVVVVEDIITAPDRAKLVTWMFGKWLARSTDFARVNDNTLWVARDGAPLLAFSDTNIILPFGWNSSAPPPFGGGTSRVTNAVYGTADKGVSWALLLAEDLAADPLVRPSARHTPGSVIHTDAEGTFAYIIGSDIYNGPGSNPITGGGIGTSDVYRTPDGVTYERMTNTAPWGPLVLHAVASFNGALWVFGGQTNGLDSTSATQKVWKSTTSGRTWVQQPDAPWSARGTVNSGQGLPVLNGKLYFMGGGVNDTNALLNTYLNDVWSLDASETWALVAAAADWSARQYNGNTAWDGKLWAINGVDAVGNISDVWSSATGVAGSWIQQTFTPWRGSHADGIVALSDQILIGPGNGQVGQPAAPGTGFVYNIKRLGFAHP